MKTWVKLYTEINRDPDIGSLTWAQRGIWSALLALCGEIDDRDERGKETGRVDTPERAAWAIRCDDREFDTALEEFEKRGMVTTDDDGVLWLPNYSKRQARPPSSRPAAVRERVQRHREQKDEGRNEDVTTLQRGVTPSDTDPDSDTDTDSDQKILDAGASSNGDEKPPTDHQAMFSALVDLHRLDASLLTTKQRGRFNALGKRLRDKGVSVGEVNDASTHWYAYDWRGKKDQPPANDSQVMEAISAVRKEPTQAEAGPYAELEPWT